MRILVHDVYDETTRAFEGSPDEVARALVAKYGEFMRRLPSEPSLQDVLDHLSRNQAFFVEVIPDMRKSERNLSDDESVLSETVRDMLGFQPHLEGAFEAARFLVGGPEPSLDAIRRALWEHDGDVQAAALHVYGLQDDEENRAAIKAVLRLKELGKGEAAALPADTHVEAAQRGGERFAEGVLRAIRAGRVLAVKLNGKHSKGAMVARDPEGDKSYLLKPGSGKQSPAAGAREDPSSQSQREAAFWAVAKLWGIDEDFPECHLVLLNGRQYAVMELLGSRYRSMERRRESDPAGAKRDFEPYRQRGRIHQWAAIDFVLGNPDRHAANIMVDDRGHIQLIDHGSAFAGSAFDPAYDRNSFVPFYLRYSVPASVSFNGMALREKLRYMETAPERAREALRGWVSGLDSGSLEHTLVLHGIDPRPALERLRRIRDASGRLDEALNRLWAGT